jgi:hypothetical protein
MPLFTKKIKGFFLNMHPDDINYIKIINSYRLYLVVYVILFIVYYFYE